MDNTRHKNILKFGEQIAQKFIPILFEFLFTRLILSKERFDLETNYYQFISNEMTSLESTFLI